MFYKEKNKKGFSMLEIVVVVAIITILIGIAVPNFNMYINKMNSSKYEADMANIYTAVITTHLGSEDIDIIKVADYSGIQNVIFGNEFVSEIYTVHKDKVEKQVVVKYKDKRGETYIYSNRYYDNNFFGDEITPQPFFTYSGNMITGITEDGLKYFSGDVAIPTSIGDTTINSIGYMAFLDSKLNSVIIPDTITHIEDMAFKRNQLTHIDLPSSIVEIGNDTFEDNLLTNIIIPENLEVIGERCFINNQISSLSIGSSVKIIKRYSFKDNILKNLVLMNSVETIEAESFYNNQLISIVIPDSVTGIGENAFGANTGGIIYANHLDGDENNTLRGYTFGDEWTIVPLANYTP